MRSLKTVLIVIVVLLISVACNNAYNKSERREKITDKLNELVELNEIPGLNFSMIYKNGKQENYSAGYAYVNRKVHMIPEFVMFSGSIGKTYAVAVIMQLVDEKKIELDEKFISYFPENDWLLRLPNSNDFTVRMLLEHTSGLPRWVFKPGVWDSVLQNPDKVWSNKDRLAYIFDDAPVHEAGKDWAYSDTNYLLLGMLIEKITDNEYYDEVRKRILKPCHLSYTFPSIRRTIPNMAQGYSKLEVFNMLPPTVIKDGVFVFNPQMEWTGGGMYCTTDDLAKWAKIFYTSDLITESLREEIITPNANGKNLGGNESYGMGSFIYHSKHGDMYGHSGTFPGFKSIFAYHPKDSIALALQINCDYATQKMSLVNYLEQILDVIREK